MYKTITIVNDKKTEKWVFFGVMNLQKYIVNFQLKHLHFLSSEPKPFEAMQSQIGLK